MLFLGTPHAGSDAVAYADALIALVGIFKPVNRAIVDVLRKDSELLRRTQSDFVNWQRQQEEKKKKRVEIANFYEDTQMCVKGKVRTNPFRCPPVSLPKHQHRA